MYHYFGSLDRWSISELILMILLSWQWLTNTLHCRMKKIRTWIPTRAWLKPCNVWPTSIPNWLPDRNFDPGCDRNVSKRAKTFAISSSVETELATSPNSSGSEFRTAETRSRYESWRWPKVPGNIGACLTPGCATESFSFLKIRQIRPTSLSFK